ncbi:hypothetical protein Ciccas_001362 [Cichlidogyrus casuarinus]|uniref:Uncharacterized protein n=1 Tax=Cichlidogyrus casuarinus TaxID=1844966 RepID=A0ABD2QK94_9PLAT
MLMEYNLAQESLQAQRCAWGIASSFARIGSGTQSDAPDQDDRWIEKKLIKTILEGYEKGARPVADNKNLAVDSKMEQIKVEFGLGLIQILDLNENEQILSTNLRNMFKWQDQHLKWEPKDFGGIEYVNIPTSKIWIPDVTLYNYADERLEEKRDCNARVRFDGYVVWQPMSIMKSTCAVIIKYFPYDKQRCSMKFGPWTYDASRVNLTIIKYNGTSNNAFDVSELHQSPEWTLLNHTAKLTIRKYSCCVETYVDVCYKIDIKRQPAFYNYVLILPCFLLSMLTLVLFWLPPETPAKMVLGMNIFVAFFLLLMLLVQSIPNASSEFPLIGNYYCMNMVLVTLSTFLCLIVVNFHFRGDTRSRVPKWLRVVSSQKHLI